jgi:hypothetical protein
MTLPLVQTAMVPVWLHNHCGAAMALSLTLQG